MYALGYLSCHKRHGLVADKIAGELIGNRCNHSTVFAQEDQRTSTRDDNIRGSVSNVGPFTIGVLFFVPLGNDGV